MAVTPSRKMLPTFTPLDAGNRSRIDPETISRGPLQLLSAKCSDLQCLGVSDFSASASFPLRHPAVKPFIVTILPHRRPSKVLWINTGMCAAAMRDFMLRRRWFTMGELAQYSVRALGSPLMVERPISISVGPIWPEQAITVRKTDGDGFQELQRRAFRRRRWAASHGVAVCVEAAQMASAQLPRPRLLAAIRNRAYRFNSHANLRCSFGQGRSADSRPRFRSAQPSGFTVRSQAREAAHHAS